MFTQWQTTTRTLTRRALLRLGLAGQSAVFTMILSAALWGAGTVLSKDTLDYFPPLLLLVVQLLASCAALWTAVLFSRTPVAWTWGNAKRGWIGILEPGLAYVFGLFGLAQTSATSASLISATEPLMTILLAWLLLREPISRRTVPLIALALAGTLIVSLTGAGGGTQTLWGDALVLGSIVCAAFYAVMSRQSIAHMPPLHMTAVQHTFGLACAVALLPVGVLAGELAYVSSIPASAWLMAILTGIVQYALAFLLYLRALKHMTAAQASLYLMLVPLFGIGGGAAFLGEQMSIMQVIGAVLILAALFRINAAPDDTPSQAPVAIPAHTGSR